MVVDGLSEENNDRDSEPWEKINNDITLWKKHYDNIEKHLGIKSNAIALTANANEIYRMSILIAAASYGEARLTAMMKKSMRNVQVPQYCQNLCTSGHLIDNFILYLTGKQKAIIQKV